MHLSRSIFFISAFILLLLSACGGPSDSGGGAISSKVIEEQLPTRIKGAEKAIDHLKSAINQGLVRNTVILNEYTRALKAQKPELSSLIGNLGSDSTTDGAMFKNLQQRLNVLKNDPELFETPAIRYQEANAIIEASKTKNFNRSLIDVVNVVADMSNGSLPRIESLQKDESLRENKAQDLGAGSQLIGNPAYGQWSNNSSGMSVWEWYGAYALFRDLVGGRSFGRNHWNQNRDWSYHSDVGRNTHGDYRKRNTNAPTSNKYSSSRSYGSNKKSYGNSSKERNQSTFSKSSQPQKSSSSSQKSSGVGGSFRNKSTFSRSSFRGK